MAEVLDFTILQEPTQVLKMMDPERTVIHVCAPTVDLVDELRRSGAALEQALKVHTPYTSALVYNLAAKLINCNHDGIKVTGEELAVKYRMSLQAMKLFFERYLDFLSEITEAKN